MANINLLTDREEGGSLGTGTAFLVVVFLITVLAYFGLVFYGKKLDSDSQSFSDSYRTKVNSFIAGDAKDIFSFQSRLDDSSQLFDQERNINKDIAAIEGAIVTGVNLGSYGYDGEAKTVKLDCYAGDYETVAKQIQSFKTSDYFSAVVAGESKYDTKSSKIEFPVTLTVK